MKKFFSLLCLFFAALPARAYPPEADIPSGYFQQSVSYAIEARLVPDSALIRAHERVAYRNNSPDTLRQVCFHLYWNIFRRGSYHAALSRQRHQYFSSDHYTNGVGIEKFLVNGAPCGDTAIDNTVLHVRLAKPLAPGDSSSFEFDFSETVPLPGMRGGREDRNFQCGQWFPQVCVYDKYGWHTDQYLGTGEFYEEYADIAVNLTLPKSFIVGHSGVLLNPAEVLPDSIVKKLDSASRSDSTVRIADFSRADTAANDATLRTWKMRADSVRTFAFTCCERYIWDACNWQGVTIHALYLKDHRDWWGANAARIGRETIAFNSAHFGRYVYPNMFVTEGAEGGGMEYPGVVFIGHFGGGLMANQSGMVIAHEIGHSWYPMMMGSNETEFAFMDEGFNTFITTLVIEHIYGRYDNFLNIKPPWDFFVHNTDERTQNQLETIQWSESGHEEPIMTHSDRFSGNIAYGVAVYPKTATGMFMLQYVMGDSAFADLMREYYARWRFRHPYPQDFFDLAMEVNQKWNHVRDLRWFFDGWFEKTWKIDYAMGCISSERTGGGYRTTVRVCRLGRMPMPVDVRITMADGRDTTVRFPVAPWLAGAREHAEMFLLPAEPERAEINPDHRIADIDRLNNATGLLPPLDVRFDNMTYDLADPYCYELFWRPSLWFNDLDGFKIGANVSGSYLGDQRKFNLWLQQGMKFKAHSFGFDLSVSNPLRFLGPQATGAFRIYNYESRRGGSVSVTKMFARHLSYGAHHTFSFAASYFDPYDFDYATAFREPFAEENGISEWVDSNGYVYKTAPLDSVFGNYTYSSIWRGNFSYNYSNAGDGWQTKFFAGLEIGSIIKRKSFEKEISFTLDTAGNIIGDTVKPAYFSYYNTYGYCKITASLTQGVNLFDGFFDATVRALGGVSIVDPLSPAQYYFATVNPIEEFDLPVYRTRGIISPNFRENRSVPNGGGYMRGYWNRNIHDNNITALNAEYNLSRLFRLIPYAGGVIAFFHPTFWWDAGNVWYDINYFDTRRLLTDYGVSVRIPLAIRISRYAPDLLGPFAAIGVSEIRFDFPIFTSSPLPGDAQVNIKHWLIGFSSPL